MTATIMIATIGEKSIAPLGRTRLYRSQDRLGNLVGQSDYRVKGARGVYIEPRRDRPCDERHVEQDGDDV